MGVQHQRVQQKNWKDKLYPQIDNDFYGIEKGFGFDKNVNKVKGIKYGVTRISQNLLEYGKRIFLDFKMKLKNKRIILLIIWLGLFLIMSIVFVFALFAPPERFTGEFSTSEGTLMTHWIHKIGSLFVNLLIVIYSGKKSFIILISYKSNNKKTI